jgi:hypothetical protein
MLLTTLLLAATTTITAAEYKPRTANPAKIRVVPVDRTPEPDNVDLSVTFPKNNQVVPSGRINLQMQVEGFPLGTNSDFERAKELYVDPRGQNIRVIVDEHAPFGIYLTFVDSLDQNNVYFNKTLNKDIPFSLKKGEHIIRAFPVRSYGESLKQPGRFAVSTFYVEKKEDDIDEDLSEPYITYNEPQGRIPYKKNGPVLLDFYLSNTELSKDGYKIRLSIDGEHVRILTDWIPYFLYGLSKGKHTVHLELLDPQNEKVPGAFNDVSKEITLD